ncbi:MAG TPA: hypothetical protein VLA43_02375 [Longimicrobiales bacterium]|nr:hypothetical protein [Longimicrobiales bacterium]
METTLSQGFHALLDPLALLTILGSALLLAGLVYLVFSDRGPDSW